MPNKIGKNERMVSRLLKKFLYGCILFSLAWSAYASEWLADLNDLPSREEIEKLSKHVDEVMQHEHDRKCLRINKNLRKMIFLHFAIYQYVVNQRSIYLSEKNTRRWAHVFGMLLKESSGDTTSITSMTGRSYSTYEAKSDLAHWRAIASLSSNGKIPLNYQTNFGLTQLSVDRLFTAFKIAKKPAYLQGRNVNLDTAIAIRRLIWFYQDFAQGRLKETDDRIHKHERNNPEYAERFQFGIDMALLLCGTNYMFKESYQDEARGVEDLNRAMASIAYCPLGNSHEGYGRGEINEKCFAEWVTLCPTLNFDIAMLTPLQYFATRNAAPVCEGTFNALLTTKKSRHHHYKPHPKKETKTTKQPEEKVIKKPGYRLKKILDSASELITNFFQ